MTISYTPLTDVPYLRRWLGNASLDIDTNDVALLNELIDIASARICTWLGYNPSLQNYQEQQEGRGQNSVYLPYSPIVKVDRVQINQEIIPMQAGNNTAGASGYYLYRHTIFLRRRIYGLLQINYQAGYAVIPPLIRHACARLAGIEYRRYDWRGSPTRQLGREWVQLSPEEQGEEVLQTLAGYRRVS